MQLVVATQVKSFEKILKKKYCFEEYISKDKPTLFWGMYNFSDLNILRNHRGVKIVVFNGTDSAHNHKKILRLLRTEVKDKIYVIAGSNWVANDLNESNIKYKKISLLMSPFEMWI